VAMAAAAMLLASSKVLRDFMIGSFEVDVESGLVVLRPLRAGRQSAVVAGEYYFGILGRSYFDCVVQANGLKDGVEIVITIIASAEDAQVQIDLSKSGNCQSKCGQELRLDGGLTYRRALANGRPLA